MHLLSCNNPQRVYNKHLGEYVYARCGNCPACRRARAAKWMKRLETERTFHRFAMFVTLTYDEINLPRLHKVGNEFPMLSDGGDICIPFDELTFNKDYDAEFFDGCLRNGGIPYAKVSDVQKFHKRLNKYFYNNVTHTYKNFRFFLVSEFGSTTFRPHFHSIYFVDSEEVAQRFGEAVSSAWSLGRCDSQFVTGSACAYVAQYLNELFDLPSFYEHRSLRPFFLCSKRPPLGIKEYNTKDLQKIFNSMSVQVPVRKSASSAEITITQLHQSIENRLFPRLPFYRQIPDYARTQLYRLAARPFKWLGLSSFKNWLSCIKGIIKQRPQHYVQDAFHDYISLLADGLSEKGINALRRVYYISKRVLYYATLFGVSVAEYIRHIDEYWSKKQLYVLKQFYEFQEEYTKENPVEEIAYMYPDVLYHAGFALDGVDTSYCVSLQDSRDMSCQLNDNLMWIRNQTKTHFKNDYFNGLALKARSKFNYLINYTYAKKRDEDAQAHSQSWKK